MDRYSFTYYRAGVARARFRFFGNKTYFAPRNMTSLAFEKEREFKWPVAPFSEDIDRRLPEAVEAVRTGILPCGLEVAGEETVCISEKSKNICHMIQPRGNNPLDFLMANGEIVACIDNERNYLGILVRDGWEQVTPLKYLTDQPMSKAEYGIAEPILKMVDMRDGIRLATDIYLPVRQTAAQRFPTILIRTCYGKKDVEQYLCFVHYGYAVVSQDTRGREQSEGVWQPIVNEKNDGDDTLTWIAKQEWSDGKIGMIGTSYLAIVQWQAAASGNEHLKAMISMVTGGVPFFDFPHRNGILSSGTMAWCASMRRREFSPKDMQRSDWAEILASRPVRSIPERGIGEAIPFWTEWMEHEYYDGYWHRANYLADQHKINIPTLYISGWYDDVSAGSMQAWDMNKRNGRANQKLVCGAWRHKMNISRDIHGFYFGSDAIRYDMFSMYLCWYDRFLKEMHNNAEALPAAQYFVIGENQWRNSIAWPPAEAENICYYLASEGNANTSGGDGRLVTFIPNAGKDCYTYDPEDPAPFLMDVSENECLVPENYKEVEKRDDVLVYMSAPLKEAITIAGEPTAVLYAASDARDTDWVVRITDVDEEGNSLRMCDGLMRARFRKSFIEPKLLIPGEIARYEISMTWICARIEKMHKICVEVTSGAANSIFPNSNTGLPMADDTETIVAQQTIYHGDSCASRVVLPMLKTV